MSESSSVARRLVTRATGNPAFADLVARIVEVRWLDRALSLAARLFIAVIPMAIVISAAVPAADPFATRLVRELELSGAGRDAALSLFAAPDTVRASVSIFSLIVVLYALQTYAGELQRMYRAAWRLTGSGFGGPAGAVRRRLIWVLSFVAFVGLSSTLNQADLDGSWGTLRDAGRVVLAVAFFAWTPYVLLDRRISARRLLPTAVINATAHAIFVAVVPLYIPSFATANTERYGLIGFTFTFFSYLFAQAWLSVMTAILGAWIVERPRAGRPSAQAAAPEAA